MARIVFQVVEVSSLVLLSLSLVYLFGLIAAGINEMHRRGRSLQMPARTHVYEAEEGSAGPTGRSDMECMFYFLVPALNEASVIADTVRSLAVEASSARIVVVDDASTDGTAEKGQAAAPRNVVTVRRRLPDARRGKGFALNAGLQAIRADVERGGHDPEKVIVVVMDADGRLSVGAAAAVNKQFAADPALGGVQLAVRIRNRQRLFTRLQDFDFWGLSALFQLGRNRLGTVGLGGNGQFSRLSALNSIGRDPWSGSLTEDLDLGISMRLAGWTALTTTDASVDQEGLESIRPLVRQRTRWLQGHMAAARRIPQIWNSDQVSASGCMEMCLMLMVPWIFILLWSAVIHLLYINFAMKLAFSGPSLYGHSTKSEVVFGVSLYLLSFAPNIAVGYIYHRRDPSIGLFRGLFYGHLIVASQYLYFLAAWRAFGRIVSGRTNWVKTERHAGLQTDPEATPVRALSA